jgi:hypothetical protein
LSLLMQWSWRVCYGRRVGGLPVCGCRLMALSARAMRGWCQDRACQHQWFNDVTYTHRAVPAVNESAARQANEGRCAGACTAGVPATRPLKPTLAVLQGCAPPKITDAISQPKQYGPVNPAVGEECASSQRSLFLSRVSNAGATTWDASDGTHKHTAHG